MLDGRGLSGIAVRTCVSCRERHEKSELIKISCYKGELSVEGNMGRGMYICKNATCAERMRKTNALAKNFHRSFTVDEYDNLMQEIYKIIPKGVD